MDDLMTWTFDRQRIACTVEKARDALWVAHPDWPDDQIEQELFARIVSVSHLNPRGCTHMRAHSRPATLFSAATAGDER